MRAMTVDVVIFLVSEVPGQKLDASEGVVSLGDAGIEDRDRHAFPVAAGLVAPTALIPHIVAGAAVDEGGALA